MPFWISIAQRGIDHAAKLYDAAVAGALDQIAAEGTQSRKRPFLVGSGQLAVSDYICR